MATVGPGAVQEQVTDNSSLLDSATEFEYVTIFNPLSDDFAVAVAQDIPTNMPFEVRQDTSGRTSAITKDEASARQVYGLNLKNPDFQSKRHVVNQAIIPAGKTLNLRGNEAKVAVRQLVNEILQRQGQKRLMADPNVRREVELMVVKDRGSMQSLMDKNIQTVQQQMDAALTKSNEGLDHGQESSAFPGLDQEDQATGAEATDSQSSGEVQRRPVGRPKKSDS